MSADPRGPDPYAVLGVPRDATPEVIDRTYRALVRRYHPDSRATTDAARAATDDTALRDVMAAYRLLGNPESRAAMDRRYVPRPASATRMTVRRRTDDTTGPPLMRAGPVYWVPSGTPRSPAQSEAATGSTVDDGLVRALTEQVAQLTVARDTNRRIGMAIGIIMTRRRIDDRQAFDVLRRISQHTNRKLRDVAEDIISDRRGYLTSGTAHTSVVPPARQYQPSRRSRNSSSTR